MPRDPYLPAPRGLSSRAPSLRGPSQRAPSQRGQNGPDTFTLLAAGGLAGLAAYAFYETRGRNRVAYRPPDSASPRTARQRDTRSRAGQGRTVTIGKPRDEVWAFFRDFENVPRFMKGVVAVAPDGERTRWTVRGPHDGEVDLETKIVDERAGEYLLWRTTEDSPIAMEGRVFFRDAPPGRGTEVTGLVTYHPPGGHLGHAAAKAMGRDARAQVRRELKRLKMLLETGEIATSANRRQS